MTCRQVIEKVNEAGTLLKRPGDAATKDAILPLLSGVAGLVGLVEKIINSAVFLDRAPIQTLESVLEVPACQTVVVKIRIRQEDLAEIIALAVRYHGEECRAADVALYKIIFDGRDEIKLRIFKHD
jgi:hypothetical protein